MSQSKDCRCPSTSAAICELRLRLDELGGTIVGIDLELRSAFEKDPRMSGKHVPHISTLHMCLYLSNSGREFSAVVLSASLDGIPPESCHQPRRPPGEKTHTPGFEPVPTSNIVLPFMKGINDRQ